jgi:hypothetical protein
MSVEKNDKVSRIVRRRRFGNNESDKTLARFCRRNQMMVWLVSFATIFVYLNQRHARKIHERRAMLEAAPSGTTTMDKLIEHDTAAILQRQVSLLRKTTTAEDPKMKENHSWVSDNTQAFVRSKPILILST